MERVTFFAVQKAKMTTPLTRKFSFIIHLICDVKDSVLDLLVDLLCCVDEGLLYIGCRFG